MAYISLQIPLVIPELEQLMASVEELKQQITDVKTSLQAAIGRVEEDVANLRDKPEGIDPSDLDPISEGLQELKDNLDALDPDPSNPPAPPEQ